MFVNLIFVSICKYSSKEIPAGLGIGSKYQIQYSQQHLIILQRIVSKLAPILWVCSGTNSGEFWDLLCQLLCRGEVGIVNVKILIFKLWDYFSLGSENWIPHKWKLNIIKKIYKVTWLKLQQTLSNIIMMQ